MLLWLKNLKFQFQFVFVFLFYAVFVKKLKGKDLHLIKAILENMMMMRCLSLLTQTFKQCWT